MNQLQDKRLTIIGAGNIGRILLTGLRDADVPADRRSGLANWPEF